jgi:phosphate starvation-inducible membrane PsiE
MSLISKSHIVNIDNMGNNLVGIFHRFALFTIGAATAWSAGWEFFAIFQKHHATVADLLLMFIYLEIGAMVGIYFKTNHMPVRFLVYIAITAITRYIVDLVAAHDKLWEIVAMSGSILILALAVLLVRMASARFPSSARQDDIV